MSEPKLKVAKFSVVSNPYPLTTVEVADCCFEVPTYSTDGKVQLPYLVFDYYYDCRQSDDFSEKLYAYTVSQIPCLTCDRQGMHWGMEGVYMLPAGVLIARNPSAAIDISSRWYVMDDIRVSSGNSVQVATFDAQHTVDLLAAIRQFCR